uniref:Two-component response regulator ARR18 n=1 Tax=Anthurium amnicola TaxID=1678845 RepID=A0A1D1YB93_9ARAE
MGSVARSDLGLDLRPPSSAAAGRSVAGFLREAAAAGEGMAAKLEEYVRGLEEERRKIEGFRRELPLCMAILCDVIEGLEEELAKCRGSSDAVTGGRPVLEEFMPMKRKFDEEEGVKQEKDFRDKVNWMSSAQLWSDNYSANTSSTTSNTVAANNNEATSSSSRENIRERDGDGRRVQCDEKPFPESKCRNGGGAFLPFKGMPSYPAGISRKEEKVTAALVPPPPLPDLSLLSPAGNKASRGVSSATEDQRSSSRGSSKGVASSAANAQSSLQAPQPTPTQQGPRKPRRCWSPELHRRFVKSLQQLGGSQAATPKQIRELMKVDGLTNDEVKSHLQKYRLHTRRVPASSTQANQQVVVLGGLWVSPENYSMSKQSTSQSASPQGPLHLASASRGMSITGGDSYEEEDGKSESYSWKGHLQRPNGEETD